MSNKIKIYFIGTSDFGAPSLEALANDGRFKIAGVITQPDKRAGRDMKVAFSPIKLIAGRLGLAVWQPINIAEFKFPDDLDLIVVAAYGQILPASILYLPKYGCVNIHGSLLPKYRGASCVQAPILAGDKETGISVIKMDENLDTGPMIAQEKIFIKDNETAGSLYKKLSDLSGNTINSIIYQYAGGRLKPKDQIDSDSSYAKKIKKDDARIDWNSDASYLERFVRAMHPWPGAFTTINENTVIKIIEVGQEILPVGDKDAGSLFLESGKLYVQCGNNSLEIKTIQLPGKKPVSGGDIINGYPHFIGRRFATATELSSLS
jgi:methionyl-tRNA formyltransferase